MEKKMSLFNVFFLLAFSLAIGNQSSLFAMDLSPSEELEPFLQLGECEDYSGSETDSDSTDLDSTDLDSTDCDSTDSDSTDSDSDDEQGVGLDLSVGDSPTVRPGLSEDILYASELETESEDLNFEESEEEVSRRLPGSFEDGVEPLKGVDFDMDKIRPFLEAPQRTTFQAKPLIDETAVVAGVKVYLGTLNKVFFRFVEKYDSGFLTELLSQVRIRRFIREDGARRGFLLAIMAGEKEKVELIFRSLRNKLTYKCFGLAFQVIAQNNLKEMEAFLLSIADGQCYHYFKIKYHALLREVFQQDDVHQDDLLLLQEVQRLSSNLKDFAPILRMAIRYESRIVLRWLVEDDRARSRIFDADQALMVAAQIGNLNLFKWLLAAFHEEISDHAINVSVLFACKENCPEILKYIDRFYWEIVSSNSLNWAFAEAVKIGYASLINLVVDLFYEKITNASRAFVVAFLNRNAPLVKWLTKSFKERIFRKDIKVIYQYCRSNKNARGFLKWLTRHFGD